MARILVVDDDPNICDMLKRGMPQYEWIRASNGAEGLNRYRDANPDLMITDTLMPEMSGHQLVEQIRLESKERMPILVISAKPSMAQFFEHSEISGFISKPLDLGVIRDRIHQLLPAGSEDEATAGDTPGTFSAEEKSRPTFILAGVDEYILKKVRIYLDSVGFEVLLAHDEAEAIEMGRKHPSARLMIQFWEEFSKFDAPKIVESLPQSKNLIYFFCKESVCLEAMRYIPVKRIVGFKESSDLLSKMDDLLFSNA